MTDLPDGVTIEDHPDEERLVLTVDGAEAGELAYHVRGDVLTAIHTEVDPAYNGRGLGGLLVERLLAEVRRRNLRLKPVCPFVTSYLGRHPEVAATLDIVGEAG